MRLVVVLWSNCVVGYFKVIMKRQGRNQQLSNRQIYFISFIPSHLISHAAHFTENRP